MSRSRHHDSNSPRVCWTTRVALLITYVAVTALGSTYMLSTRETPGLDMQVYWRAAQVLHGLNPSTQELYAPSLVSAGSLELPFTYPPLAALLFYPMGGMTLEQAWTVTTVTGMALLGLYVLVILHLAPFSRRWFGTTPVVTILAFLGVYGLLWNLYPIRFTLAFGQVNIALAILILWDLGRHREHKWGTGVLTGLAAGFKITPAAMGLVPLMQGRWRTVLGMGIGVAATVVVSAIFLPREVWDYFTAQLWQTDRVGEDARISNLSLNGSLQMLNLPEGWASSLWILLVLVVLVGGALGIRRASRARDVFSATLIGALVMLLISPISWEHHWVWVGPLLLALVPHNPRTARAWEWAVGMVLAGLLLWTFASAPSVFAAELLEPGVVPEVVLTGPPALERMATMPVWAAVVSGIWLCLRPYSSAVRSQRAPELP